MKTPAFYLLILLLSNSCRFTEKGLRLYIEKTVISDSIPSASGITSEDDSAYIIGDDATGIYKLSLNSFAFRKISMLTDTNKSLYRIPKSIKHDFESAAIGKINNIRYLVAFGSGTLSPYRDSLLVLNLDNENDLQKFSLAGFYKLLFQNSVAARDINIEGATIAGNYLYLLNRGNNMVIRINWLNFFDYVVAGGSTKFAGFKTYKIELPGIAGIQARFSGACTLDSSTILFCASVEDTKNWVEDGKILGSYIGMLKLTNGDPQLNKTFLLEKDGKPLPIKLESLDVSSATKNRITITTVADNDDGSSAFYFLYLN